jgi:type IV pilus assembly protein PilA
VLQNTLKNIRARRDEEEGFTLIELMVVVLIIAILIAIAIPTFLGSRGRANDRAAQSSLRNGVTAAKTIFTDTSTYTGATAAALTAVEPSLSFLTTVSTGPKVIQVVLSGANDVILSAQSASNKCYFITDSSTYGTAFAMANNGGCTGQTAPGVQAAAPTSGSAVTSAAAGTAPAWYTAW